MQQAAYVASDGTEMIAVGVHRAVNRCASEKHRHWWQDVRAGVVCLCCKQYVREGDRAFLIDD